MAAIHIVLASNDAYAPYLGVCIESIIENSSSCNNYCIHIIERKISSANKRRILSLLRENISIDFLPAENILNNVDKSRFFVDSYVTIDAYLRLFIPELFPECEKVLYLDCDLVINGDIAELYNIDLNNKAAGAIIDYCSSLLSKNDAQFKDLGFLDEDIYFNAGVILFNIAKTKRIDFVASVIETLKKLEKPRFRDQCVLNAVLKNDVLLLDPKYNVQWWWNIRHYVETSPFAQSSSEAFIIHYITANKPWNKPHLHDLGDFFWKYAKNTPFYEQILYQNMQTNPVPAPASKPQVPAPAIATKNPLPQTSAPLKADKKEGSLEKKELLHLRPLLGPLHPSLSMRLYTGKPPLRVREAIMHLNHPVRYTPVQIQAAISTMLGNQKSLAYLARRARWKKILRFLHLVK